MQYVLKTREEYPERFRSAKVPFNCLFTLAQALLRTSRLDEAEATLKKALGVLESEGKEFHPDMVLAMHCLGGVYQRQGRKKEATEVLKKVKKLVPQVFPKDHPDFKRYM